MKRLLLALLMTVTGMSAVGQGNDIDVLVSRGNDLLKGGKNKESIECFEKAIELLRPTGNQERIKMLEEGITVNKWFICQDSIFSLAKMCNQRGEYEKSNEYYERLVFILDSMGMSKSMLEKAKNLIAVEEINQGIAYSQKKQYYNARLFMTRALKWATGKTYKTAHRWLGNICDWEVTEVYTGAANLERAIALCEEGERHYDTAGAVIHMMEIRLWGEWMKRRPFTHRLLPTIRLTTPYNMCKGKLIVVWAN